MSEELVISAPLPSAMAGIMGAAVVPALIAARGEQAAWRYLEFFTANIRNPNTRRAYARAASGFFSWCERLGLGLTAIQPVHVGAWVEELIRSGVSVPTVKQQLAGVRMPFLAGEGNHRLPGERRNPGASTANGSTCFGADNEAL